MDNPDLNVTRQLKSRLTTANKQWLQGFLGAGGVQVLIHVMRKRLGHVPRSDH